MYTFKNMLNTPLVTRIHKKLERAVISEADAVVTVTKGMKAELEELSPKRIVVITNGFDADDYKEMSTGRDSKFSITYTGLFVRDRNPSVLWRVLGEKGARDERFRKELQIKIIGHTDKCIPEDILNNGLERNLYVKDYVSHPEAVREQQNARVLLLAGGQQPEATAILTGKFFEYLATGNRILAFGPKGGDMDDALIECGAGDMFEYDDYEGAKEWIEREYEKYLNGSSRGKPSNIEKYSREKLCEKMSELIEETILNKRKL